MTMALSIHFWQAGAHTMEMDKSKPSAQVLTKGTRALVYPTESFVRKLTVGKMPGSNISPVKEP